MRDDAYIGRMNMVHGPIDLIIGKRSCVGNTNKITRAPQDIVAVGRGVLRLGELSSITANHRVDCASSVRLGNFTTLAGAGSQIWTHGYIHDTQGPGRYRIDGGIEIGNNVYIGAGCIISMGVRIASGAIVGAGVTVARNLDEPGLYVSAAIRQLPRPSPPDERVDLRPVLDARLCERVYVKTSR
ncbi:acyltransferase [Glaciimonas sp. GNP009]